MLLNAGLADKTLKIQHFVRPRAYMNPSAMSPRLINFPFGLYL
jgi:hypothetical protein